MAIGRGSGGWGRRKPFGGGMAGGLAGRGAQGLSAGGGGAGGTRIGMSDFMRNMPEGMNSISTSGEWNYIDPSTLPPEATRRPDGEISRLNPHCFVAGTKVAVQNKETKNIEDIEVGDLVVCCDTSTGTLEESAVTHTFKHPDTDGYLVINESLGVTPNHEIYTGTDWVSAANLKVGDNIQMIGGDLATVSNIEKVDKPVTTYNLEVANRHNYYADGFLVHNKLVIMPGDKERANKRHEMFVDKYGPDYMKRDDYKELQKKHPREKTPITWRTRRDLTDMEKNTPISPITINGAPAGGMPASGGGGSGGGIDPKTGQPMPAPRGLGVTYEEVYGPNSGYSRPRAGDRVGNRVYGLGEPQTRDEWDAIAEAREEGRKPSGGGDWWGGSPPAPAGGGERKIWEGSGPDGVMTADDIREFQKRDNRDDRGDWKMKLEPYRGPPRGVPDRTGDRYVAPPFPPDDRGGGAGGKKPWWHYGGGGGGSWVPGYGPGGQTPTNPMGGGAPAGGAQGLRAGGFSNLFNRLQANAQANAQSNAFNNYSRNLGNRRTF